MSSKSKKLSFFQAIQLTSQDLPGSVVILSCADGLLFKFLKNRYKKFLPQLVTKASSEVSKEWLENTLFGLSLFGSDESYWVINAESFNSQVKKYLETKNWEQANQKVVLAYQGTIPKEWKKNETLTIIEVEAIKYFDYGKWLDFICDEEMLYLSFEAREFFLSVVPQTLLDYYQAVQQLKLNSTAKEVSLNEVRELFPTPKYDQFQLADAFTQKKFRGFFEKLIHFEQDYETLRALSTFMQGHLIKIYDPSYMEGKDNITSYDRKIKSAVRDWKPNELKKSIQFFAQLETLTKMKSTEVSNKIRSGYLKTFY